MTATLRCRRLDGGREHAGLGGARRAGRLGALQLAGHSAGGADTAWPLKAVVPTRRTAAAATNSDERIVRAVPPLPPNGTVAVSDLPFLSATNGWGPVERDKSNGEQAAGDGKTITLQGVTFAKGLGTNSISDVEVYLGGHCSSFTATVGVDDEQGSGGSVTFSGDRRRPHARHDAAPDGLLGQRDDQTCRSAGAQILDLVVGDGGRRQRPGPRRLGAPTLTCDAPLSPRAALTDLEVNGHTVPGFDPAVDELRQRGRGPARPAGRSPPRAAENGTVAITPPTSVPGTATVTVTSEDGSHTTTYTVDARADVDVVPGGVGGTVPATLSLTLGGPASFGPFTPGADRTTPRQTTANVISTAGNATLSAGDPRASEQRGVHRCPSRCRSRSPRARGRRRCPTTR